MQDANLLFALAGDNYFVKSIRARTTSKIRTQEMIASSSGFIFTAVLRHIIESENGDQLRSSAFQAADLAIPLSNFPSWRKQSLGKKSSPGKKDYCILPKTNW